MTSQPPDQPEQTSPRVVVLAGPIGPARIAQHTPDDYPIVVGEHGAVKRIPADEFVIPAESSDDSRLRADTHDSDTEDFLAAPALALSAWIAPRVAVFAELMRWR